MTIYQFNVFPDIIKELDEQQYASHYDIILVVEEFLACARNLCMQLVSYQCSFTDLRRHYIELKGTRTTSFLGKILSVLIHVEVKEGKSSETDSIKFKISSKTPRGKKDSTKRHHHRHHKRQPGEQQFPKQVVTGYFNI